MFKTMTGSLNPKSKPTDEEIQKIPSYVFCRWLSGNPVALQAANMINFYPDIPIENQYQMVKTAFAGKIKYIPYPKSEKEHDQKQVEYLAKHFKISMEKAKEYLKFISEEELNEIVTMYQEFESR